MPKRTAWELLNFLEVLTLKKRSSIKSEFSKKGYRLDYEGVKDYILFTICRKDVYREENEKI